MTTSGFSPPDEFDDYVIVRPLGAGVTGQVFVAEDAVLARPVAIKFLAVEPDPSARQRFLLEARAAARIQHPNVVGIYRVGELADRPYIVSELVRGTPLAELPRPLEWTKALALGIDLARGLAAAHRSGVVHCDIKPANVMVTDDSVAKLVDFGLAQIVRDGNAGSASLMSGTPDYMAPEVWDAQPPTRRSDVYSLGAVLHELVSGKPPFGHVAPAALASVVRAEDAPRLDTDARFAAIVARCLDRDPARRFASGEELRQALEQLEAARKQTASASENPYRGLRPFEAAHRGVFFGRGVEIAAVVDRLAASSMVVVAGDSGVGKSSLVRAGVIPTVLDDATRPWRAMTLVPGRRPLAALARALDDAALADRLRAEPGLLARELHRRAGRGGILLFVDQLEEVVTVADTADVAAFDAALGAIAEGVAGVKLIATIRSDFIPRVVALPRLGQELARLLYFVRALPPERIRDVITGPSAATHVSFESDAMIDELAEATALAGSGGLPLLSFALAELWEAHDRERHLITRATLDEIGGVAGALARHADTVIAGLTPADRVRARRVLLRLVSADGTRVRRAIDELAADAGTDTALAALVKGRLVVAYDGESGTTYEIAHEVLVRGWPTLREWLDADAEQRARRDRLATACAEWQRVGRRGDASLRGVRLAEALSLDRVELLPIERDFIAASARLQRRRTWLVRAAIVAVLAAIATVYGVQRYLDARTRARAVDAALAEAQGELASAREADREQHELALDAFAKFDRGDGADGGAPSPAGETAWQAALAQRAIAARTYRLASRSIESALALDPSRTEVRDLLGDVLLERALLAELDNDAEMRDELVGRLAQYDADGSRRARWARGGVVTVHAPPGATITIDGARTGERSELAAGSHVVEVDAPARAPVREPIFVTRDAAIELTVALPASVPAGFVYIPAGHFLFGSAADEDTRKTFYATAPLHDRATAAFLIARDEVTFGDWLAYVDAQPASERAHLVPNLPIQSGPGIVVTETPAGWELALQPVAKLYRARVGEPIHYDGRARRAVQDWSRFPVIGISANDAKHYVDWLARSGRVVGARLCTEVEWERAARGADGRDYPAGHPLGDDDANIDVTYGHDLMGPDEIGSHPASISPYGLDDTCGNAFELTASEHGGVFVGRGGGFGYDRKQGNLANRAVVATDYRENTLGFRVCATAD